MYKTLDTEKLEDRIKNYEKDSTKKNEVEDEIFNKLMRPEYFLKSYNLTPPSCE